MTIAPWPDPAPSEASSRLRDTREAFDSVADEYDGPRGNNALIQDMRREMWRWLERIFPPGSHLLDLGCGTGLDAAHMAELGHRITAIDWSPRMIDRTRERAERAQLGGRVRTLAVGAHELQRIDGLERFDGAYSNLGALNCLPDLESLARECARLLKPDGRLVFTVIGRWCPWEIGHYALRADWSRIRVRFAREMVPVRMNGRTVWTTYWTPLRFYRRFAGDFALVHYRGLCLFAPPPYLTGVRERHPAWYERSWRLDRRVAGWPVLRAAGDHFLIVMRKRPAGEPCGESGGRPLT